MVRRFVGVLLIVFLIAPGAVLAESPAPQPGQILHFENFDAAFGNHEVRLAAGWHRWSRSDCNCFVECACGVPEYKQSNPLGAFPERNLGSTDGNAQQLFTFYASHHAGISKSFAVPAGARVRVTAWTEAWSSGSDDPQAFDGAQNMRQRVGVDPNGGRNATSADIVWGEAFNSGNSWSEAPAVEVVAGAQGSVTVFVSSNPAYPLKHNDVYWDNVTITFLEQETPDLSSGGVPAASVPAPTPAAAQSTLALAGLTSSTLPDPVLAGLVEEPAEAAPAETGGGDPLWMLGGLAMVGVASFVRRQSTIHL